MALTRHEAHTKRHPIAVPIHHPHNDPEAPHHRLPATGIGEQITYELISNELLLDGQPRLVPMEGERYHLDAESALGHVDENTIGVVAILGSTFDGSYEPVKEIAAGLDELQEAQGIDVPIHVDGASGGFVAPFIQPN